MESLRALGLASRGLQEEEDNVAFYELYGKPKATEHEQEGLRLLALEVAATAARGRIWQRERFTLTSSAVARPSWWQRGSKDAEVGPLLWGSTVFGDNVEDEWFIVALLMHLTHLLPGTTARIWDNDGEFLLIEAAYVLPRWLKPDTAGRRVWLHGGDLHLVPLPSPSVPTLPPSPSLAEAWAIVRSSSVPTLASPPVQSAIRQRIAGLLPASLQSPADAAGGSTRSSGSEGGVSGGAGAMHRAAVKVPARIAHLLRQQPQLLAPAVEAFYGRDAAAMKAASRMELFPAEDMVIVSTIFNRALYAQLKQQEFQGLPGFPLPATGSPDFAAAELGMRLTAGFEMLCAAAGRSAEPGGDVQAHPATLQTAAAEADCSGASWEAFQAAVAAAAGSGPRSDSSEATPQQLRARFQAVHDYQRAAAVQASPVQHIRHLLQEPISAADFSGGRVVSDSDAWLAESGAELEAELQRVQAASTARGVKSGEREGGRGGAADSQEAQLDQLSSRLQAFLRESSSFEGADPPTAAFSSAAAAGGLDPAAFLSSLSAILGTGFDGPGGGGGDKEGESSDESSDFYDDGDSDSTDAISDEEGAGLQTSGGGGWPDAQTDTDSDDEAPGRRAGFMEQYGDVLDDQLAGTAMGKSFERVADPQSTAGQGSGSRPVGDVGGASGEASGAPDNDREGNEQEPSGGGLRPVDIDLNLVSSMLASFESQQGMPGPASNMAGMLGLHLPPPPQHNQPAPRGNSGSPT